MLTLKPFWLSRDEKKISLLGYVALCIMGCVFYFSGLAAIPPIDRDEPRFAQATKQMVESGDYGRIFFHHEPRHQKPIGIYWIQSLSLKIFGPEHQNDIWVYRLPSALAVLITVLLMAWFVARLTSPAVGLLAALILGTSFIVTVEAHLAKTDAALLLCVTLAQLCFLKIFLTPDHQKISRAYPLVLWASLGAGFLIKGPLGVMIFGLTALSLLVCRKKFPHHCWWKKIGLAYGPIIFFLITLPWFISITLNTGGAFLQQSAGNDLFAKIWQGQGYGGAWPGTHTLALMLTFWPWWPMLIFLPALRHDLSNPIIFFCLSWLLPSWLVFELTFTKLLHYTMPLLPALSLLLAITLEKLRHHSQINAPKRTAVSFILLILSFTAFAAILCWLFYDSTPLGFIALLCGVCLVLLVGTIILMKKIHAAIIVAPWLAASLAYPVFYQHIIPPIEALQTSSKILHATSAYHDCDNHTLVTLGYREPSLIFLNDGRIDTATSEELALQAIVASECHTFVLTDRYWLSAENYFDKKGYALQLVDAFQGTNYNKRETTIFRLAKAVQKP